MALFQWSLDKVNAINIFLGVAFTFTIDMQYKTPNEVYFVLAIGATRGYIDPRSFSPIF